MNIRIEMEDGEFCEVQGDPEIKLKKGGALLGGGGQGSVYRVKYSGDNKIYALKIYKKTKDNRYHPDSSFIKNLAKNISKGSPSDTFIWPLLLTKHLGKNLDRIGYMMPMYDSSFVSMGKICNNKVVPKDPIIKIKMLFELVNGFEMLHARGYSYQDLNKGGVVFNCNTGEVRICDNDNVAPYGENLGIKGMFKYMAPEVAINMFLPDKYSDYFSLAVLFFMLLTHGNPLEGKLKYSCEIMTDDIINKIYGTNPVFVFDPNNLSNRPDPTEQAMVIKGWSLLPPFIQDLFVKTFTHGMPGAGKTNEDIARDRQLRATDKDWTKALLQWIDSLVCCPHCNNGTYLLIDANGRIQQRDCPNCGRQLNVKLPILTIKKGNMVTHKLIMDNVTKIRSYHIFDDGIFTTIANIIPSIRIPDYYAVVNKTNNKWNYYLGSDTKVCGPNDKIPCIDNVVIVFNQDHEAVIASDKKVK